jgi:phenol 2-monooxygenase
VATIPFVSGLTVQYAPSAIVDTTHQACAPGILIGRRLPPQNVVRAADGLPVNVQDLLPADSRFKLLVFAGTVRGDALDTVADTIQNSLHGVLGGAGKEAVDVVTIVKGHVFAVDYMSVPASLRPHWSKCAKSYRRFWMLMRCTGFSLTASTPPAR